MPLYKENPFLSQLLTLQQDGSGAISAPSNWKDKPLLEVSTDLDQQVDRLASRLISDGGTNKTGTWWFLVGSPGNGKSAAVGRLVRRLRNEHNASFRLGKNATVNLGKTLTNCPNLTCHVRSKCMSAELHMQAHGSPKTPQ